MKVSLLFNKFIDDTRNTSIIAGIGLLLLLWSYVGPGKYMFGSSIGKISGILVLFYASYVCFSTTSTLTAQIPNIYSDPFMQVERNNIIFSYIFGISLIMVGLYSFKILLL